TSARAALEAPAFRRDPGVRRATRPRQLQDVRTPQAELQPLRRCLRRTIQAEDRRPRATRRPTARPSRVGGSTAEYRTAFRTRRLLAAATGRRAASRHA